MRRLFPAFAVVMSFLVLGLSAQQQVKTAAPPPLTKDQAQFFESKIRPIFVENCYKCHSPSNGAPRAGLELDWKGGWEKGGSLGPAIVPGDPDKSLLILAVRYTDNDLQMPPSGKLSTSQVNDLVSWVRMGAPDSRTARPATGAIAYGGSGKNHWSFKPVTKPSVPAVKNTAWVKNDIDRFVLAKLEEKGMTANETADKRTLIRRAYFDLIGLPPTPEQVTAFLNDNSPKAFEKVVDALLASPRYGERWGRHWLDVARYSDTKGQFVRARESSVYPYAWTYRDYVIKAFNDDLPYDQFIREQLAADRLVGKTSPTLAALGFLTLGDRFNGNQNDVINDRIDVTTKAFLGLTVTCARCHDHKFDPIPSADYYSLYGVFSSSMEPDEKPVITPIAPLTTTDAAHADYVMKRNAMNDRLKTMVDQNMKDVFGDYRRLGGVYLMATQMPESQRAAYLKKNGAEPEVLKNWIQFTTKGGKQAVSIFGIWNALARIPAANFEVQAPRVIENQFKKERAVTLNPLVLQAFRNRSPSRLSDVANVYAKLLARTDPEWESSTSLAFSDAVFRFLQPKTRNQFIQLREQSEMLDLVDAGAPVRAPVLVDSLKPADAHILVRGQAETPGDIVPRRFLEVLSGPKRTPFHDGSGRLELANAIASKTNPLTARVMVNRVWQHHFGNGFVSTPDDLGNQSAPPTHPELLDWLATRFMADGWSVKKLHKLILMSATWQQGSTNNPQFAEKDPFNDLLWRANVRRLEFEPLRDSILSIGGTLDLTLGGHPVDLSAGTRVVQGKGAAAAQTLVKEGITLSTAPRRTVYGYIDRSDLVEVLNTFDFATPVAPMGKRYETIVPQQALFLMNSPLVIEQVRNVVNRDAFQNAGSDDARIQYLYELFFQRPANAEEIRTGQDFVSTYSASAAAPAPAPATRGGRGGNAQAQGRGGRGAATPVRVPLSAWQEYAHALLLTNEADFVN